LTIASAARRSKKAIKTLFFFLAIPEQKNPVGSQPETINFLFPGSILLVLFSKPVLLRDLNIKVGIKGIGYFWY
jgi:hypothetical protein